MKITLEEAARIARLAHLRFSDEDLARMRGQLDLILEHVGALQKLDVGDIGGIGSAVEPARDAPASLREDKPIAPLGSECALDAAPESGQGHFLVPRVIG